VDCTAHPTPRPPGAQATPGGHRPRVGACSRAGCQRGAWFVVHHVAVCSSACAEKLAAGAPARGARAPTPDARTWPQVARAVRATSSDLTLAVISSRGRGTALHCWWWVGPFWIRTALVCRTAARDVTTDAGLFAVLRALVRKTNDAQLRGLRIAAGGVELDASSAPWHDIVALRDPLSRVRQLQRRAYQRARLSALRARYRQRGVSQDGTADQPARVA